MNKKVGRKSCLVMGAVILFALLAWLCIPHTPKSAAELCGTYVLDCELIHGVLILCPDGTFAQTVIIKATSEKISSKGTWTYKTRVSSGLTFGDVVLDAFVAVLEWPDELKPDYAHSQPGVAVLPVEYWFGELLIGGSVDSWPNWKKVK